MHKASLRPQNPLHIRLLFICSQNKWRSLTAERLFDDHPHHEARSAGTEPGARVRVTAGHLGWAEIIFVMERRHAERLREKFATELGSKPLLVLRIRDKYQFGDSRLVALLQQRLAEHLGPRGFS
ncbi:low molecular weight protein tyrosine phosphatase family protein [Hymenobacter terrenus]|uniref:low molecular weight protein tyrosine phosphatase family protein n=1 Tax=Hymenobacter terrenus TaxID=1629124 RepID=UPI0006198AE6|nr:protein-tyrosine-phosphatase [Hymenobacter terrenus]